MTRLQNRFSSALIRTLMIAVMAMLICHITKAAMADFGEITTWTPSIDGSGVQLNNVNNGSGFQVAFAANPQPGPDGGMSAGYKSTFTVEGNFVIEMNYALNTWPTAPNGVRLAISLGPNVGQTRESTIFTSGDGYNFTANNGWHIVPATDRSGSLILANMGGTLSGYYWSTASAAWVLVGSASGYSGSYPVNIGSWTDSTFGGQSVGLTLSDLQINTGATAVMPGPIIIPAVTPVPEPTTFIAGVLMLLPFGLSGIRMLRKSRKA
jgi:hypothetical protein